MKPMKLAGYACDPTKTVGRLHKENLENDKNPFLRDRDRIINSAAFRRLEYKTQVFVNHLGDHYRTRLTHSLEVSQISRLICRELDLNEDLAETIALCHDVGHPPFGHSGEDGLNEAARQYGGFDHNLQTIKIITHLEQRYAGFDGLNLTWETIEGTIKHNGPLLSKNKNQSDLPTYITSLSDTFNLRLETFPSLEAQVAGLADDIAYCNHDIDDGIRANMFKLKDLQQIPIIEKIYRGILSAFPDISESRQINETIRTLIRYMIKDLTQQSLRNIEVLKIKTPNDARERDEMVIRFSKEVEQMKNELKSFLMQNVYRDYRVNRMSIKAKQLMNDLFTTLMLKPDCLPTEWYQKVKNLNNENERAGIIIDYISGMTDRYAIEEHKRLFNPEYF